MSGTVRNDPYVSFFFVVEIDGLLVGGFSEVSGLQVETEVEEYREGGRNDYVHKFPKGSKQSTITLKRGITDSDTLWKWHQAVVQGGFSRQSGRIILRDARGNEKWHWLFVDAYPVKWVGPDLSGDGSAIAIETLELAHNGLTKG
jgi:phage tail-like protein